MAVYLRIRYTPRVNWSNIVSAGMAEKDLYQILEVPRNASPTDIKKVCMAHLMAFNGIYPLISHSHPLPPSPPPHSHPPLPLSLSLSLRPTTNWPDSTILTRDRAMMRK